MSEGSDFFRRDAGQSPHRDKVMIDRMLSRYDEDQVNEFVMDLFLVFELFIKLDEVYGRGGETKLEEDLREFKDMIKDWGRKYRDILLELKEDGIQLKLMLYFKENSLDEVAKVIRIMDNFQELESEDGKLTAFFDQDGQNTLTIIEEDGRLRLVYAIDDMVHAKSPEFRLCTYYGMKDGFNQKINLQEYEDRFQFETVGHRNDWFRRYRDIGLKYGKR